MVRFQRSISKVRSPIHQQDVNRHAAFHRRGAIAVLAAILMVVFLAFTALSIDIGYIVLTRTELQNAADSGALAGVAKLALGETAARAEAKTFGQLNSVAKQSVAVADTDVDIGNWNTSTLTFTSGVTPKNALQVTARRDPTNSRGELTLFFAPAFGTEKVSLRGVAVAAMSSVGAADVVPMALRNNWSFGAVDPKVVAANPGKDGPSYPLRPTYTNAAAFFNIGDQVTVAIFGQGSQSPVHLALDVPNFGDESKVFRGEMADRTMAVGDRYFVIGSGTGQGGLVGDIASRISTYSSTHAKRTVVLPVVKTLNETRNSQNQLTGRVEVVDFVAVHLDATPQVLVPKPDKPNETMTIMLVVGTIVRTNVVPRGARTTPSVVLPDPSVFAIQLVK